MGVVGVVWCVEEVGEKETEEEAGVVSVCEKLEEEGRGGLVIVRPVTDQE